MMQRISIITPTYNEAENVEPLHRAVEKIFADLPDYEYEHIFADNCSEDETLAKLKALAAGDTRVKVIANASNFGPTRSVFNAVLSAGGDAVIILAADFQDPPELIPEFIEKWRDGYKIVFGIRRNRRESRPLTMARRLYYRVLRAVSEDELVNDAGDFVLFDKDVLEVLKSIKSANPYLRGLLSSLGYRHCGVPYDMQARRSGKSGASALGLFSYAINGFVNHSLAPIRLATFAGFFLSAVCFATALVQLMLKLILGSTAPAGIPTLIVAMFFLAGAQLFLLGFIGEIVGQLFRQSKNLPVVIESERINFSE